MILMEMECWFIKEDDLRKKNGQMTARIIGNENSYLDRIGS